MYRAHVLVCGGTGCTSSGSAQIIQALKDEIKKNGLENEVAVVKTGCHGLCAEGPVMIVYPEAVFYSQVKPEDVEEIVSEHLLKGRVVERLVYHEAKRSDGSVSSLNETTFYKKQHRIAEYNDMWERVQNAKSYWEALKIIAEHVDLVDLDGRYKV